VKRIYPIVVILAAVSLLLPQAAGARETIKVALALSRDVAGTDFINGMYELFKREVEARTNGALTVEIIYGGALGDPVSRLDQMRKNVIQMSDASDGNYATVYPDIQVLNIPYLFATEPSAWKVLDGRFGRELAEDLRTRTGIRVLGWWESGGFKHFSSSRPLRSPADFAGRNMRALGPLTMPLIAALKGSAIPIGFGDLYTALATGLVDVQDNSLSVFRRIRLYEVHKFILLSGHTYSVGALGINNAFYIQLSDAERAAVDAAAAKAIAFNREGSRVAEQEAVAALRIAGVQLIKLTPQEKEEFRQVTQGPVIEWLKPRVGVPSLIDAARSAAQAEQ
jgi:tripartite ATP-independent transporter DctP family solute receptor